MQASARRPYLRRSPAIVWTSRERLRFALSVPGCAPTPVRHTSFREPSSTTRETHLSARCRRRSKSWGCAVATRISRLPMRFRATPRVASLAMARFRKRVSPAREYDVAGTAKAEAASAGSAGIANNEGGATALVDKTREPTTSARTKPGPRAMAVNNECRRRVLPRRRRGPQRGSRVGVAVPLFAAPVLPGGDAEIPHRLESSVRSTSQEHL